ncbi:BlaI/MecI/CopY family transcriptional regulator [Pseudoflavonifractor sp. An85]|uniref:BlaI/MecI/CopY family transcriptional regulator n=1 Tax=Pseudoflavonifractor sp. An85 TaxID=1965661 RepID=UPI000B38E2D3|nr:BlaI/MecI/CopY family transcriptional regulator [Pseudoflavonifractor sp. An85]OUN25382.1 BlaI/MecI/CopY family transcriptional regulator [Pseudoflavonifractor sp. An85]
MEVPKIFESEYRFCLILWEHEPVTTTELVRLCREKLEWKRTTTYTVIKRLCERGVLRNDGGVVTTLVSKDQAQAAELDELVEKKFEGSIPAFVAAFGRRQKLSQEDIQQMQQLIDRYRKGEGMDE